MKCAICIKVKEGDPFDAVTIADGTAVCEAHFLGRGSISVISDKNVRVAYGMLRVWEGRIAYQTDDDLRED